MREVRSWINWFLAYLFDLLRIKRLRNVLIKWATQKVHDELQEQFNEEGVGEVFVQHGTYVFNRVLLKIKDGHLTDEEAQQVLKYLRRFYLVWQEYKSKTERTNLKKVMGVVEDLQDAIR